MYVLTNSQNKKKNHKFALHKTIFAVIFLFGWRLSSNPYAFLDQLDFIAYLKHYFSSRKITTILLVDIRFPGSEGSIHGETKTLSDKEQNAEIFKSKFLGTHFCFLFVLFCLLLLLIIELARRFSLLHQLGGVQWLPTALC